MGLKKAVTMVEKKVEMMDEPTDRKKVDEKVEH